MNSSIILDCKIDEVKLDCKIDEVKLDCKIDEVKLDNQKMTWRERRDRQYKDLIDLDIDVDGLMDTPVRACLETVRGSDYPVWYCEERAKPLARALAEIRVVRESAAKDPNLKIHTVRMIPPADIKERITGKLSTVLPGIDIRKVNLIDVFCERR